MEKLELKSEKILPKEIRYSDNFEAGEEIRLLYKALESAELEIFQLINTNELINNYAIACEIRRDEALKEIEELKKIIVRLKSVETVEIRNEQAKQRFLDSMKPENDLTIF